MIGQDCDECEVDAMRRMVAARDLLDLGLWLEGDPLACVEGALKALTMARQSLRSAGYGR